MRRATTTLAMALAAVGCSKGSAPAATGVVIGVTSDFPAGSSLGQLDVHLEASGAASDRSYPLGSDKGLTNFPLEIAADDLADGAPVSVTLKGMLGTIPEPRVVREAATRALGGQRLLLAVNLDLRCQVELPGGTDGGTPPCQAGQTCIEGVCSDPFVPPSQLVPYDPNWPNTLPDPCKPPAAGKAAVTIGAGESEFQPTANGSVAQIFYGPQGGYHVYVGFRTRNLRRRGTVEKVTGAIPAVPSQNTSYLGQPFSLSPQKDGSCTLAGMRLQIATKFDPNQQVEPLFGKTLIITATATDKDGATASDQRTVTLSNGFQ